MEAHVIGLMILVPFVLVFAYAGIHEYLRYKSEGSATYGLVYDEDTGTTYVSGVSEEDEAFDPETYDPNSYKESEDRKDDDDKP
jgi:hypothetical protein